MITHQEVAERTGTEIPPHLIAQAEVPVATNWRQGDVYVMKHAAGPKGTGIDISQGAGHKVVAGEADRNSHILNGDGMFYPGQYRDRFDFGLLLVPAATDENPTPLAVLTHTDEHGSVAFGPGSYRVFGQVSHEQELQRAVD
jgi:hypothetical protein